MIPRKEAKKLAMSRDCSCVKGKDRDNNYNETIDKIYDSFKKELDDIIKMLKTEEIPIGMIPGSIEFVKQSMEWDEIPKPTLFENNEKV